MKSDKIFAYSKNLNTNNSSFKEEKYLIKQIESFLDEENSDGILIAIKGDWGVGKTSILKMLECYFKNYRECNTVFYEAWKYHSEKNPLLPLLTLMDDTLETEKEYFKTFAKKSIAKYGEDIGKFVLRTGANFIGILEDDQKKMGEGLNDLKKYFLDILNIAQETTQTELSEFDKQFNTIKKASKSIARKMPKGKNREQKEIWKSFIGETEKIEKQLFLFVDDLDRLMPKDGVKLFEAIRFYLKIPNTVVIMGINDKILTSHILEHYRVKNDEGQNEEFLEKLFDFSYELKPLKYDKTYMENFHLDKLNNNIKSKISEIFMPLDLDSLTHRKWKKIFNRLESEKAINTENEQVSKNLLKIACFKELFPESERFSRSFPRIIKVFSEANPATIIKELEVEVKEKLFKIIKFDNAFLHFPVNNFNKLFKYEEVSVDESAI